MWESLTATLISSALLVPPRRQWFCCHFAQIWAPRRHRLCRHFDFLPALGAPKMARMMYPLFFGSRFVNRGMAGAI